MLPRSKSRGLLGAPVAEMAVSVRCIGRRRDLARAHGLGQELGIGMVNEAIAALLAQGALPRLAALCVAAGAEEDLAADVAAGIVRGCQAHDVEIGCSDAATTAGQAHVAVVICGGVVAPVLPAEPGFAVLGLRNQGLVDDDLDWACRQIHTRTLQTTPPQPAADSLGGALLAPSASFFSVLREPLRKQWPARLVAVGGPGLSGSLAAALPVGVDAVLDLAAWSPPAPFPELLGSDPDPRAAAAACSLGCGMLVLVPAADERRWLDHCGAWAEPACRLGWIGSGGCGVTVRA